MFLEILQNSQEKTCARASLLIKLRQRPATLLKKETLTQLFSCEFCKIFINTFSAEHLWAAAFGIYCSQVCCDIFLFPQTSNVIAWN